ncbi:ferrochelatase (plasmid) [Halorussus salilacus]|uniref:ferrochelatase n=1 Tax=Halorussus salilacus TaxID=2953750 RepID=UPI0020A1E95D|nr:ferrochelatase [Halorussus salilacus]USZ69704.1 ferrochelatase [Halorussus salilacus]
MTTGVVLLNFGEPSEPTRENVVAYLERIFLNNASLEDADTEEEARERARQLAERRAPGLIEEYEEIGGSPLNPQATAQADALGAELDARGYDVETYVGMQFTEPFIGDAVEAARDDGVDELVGLPVYPLCGASTTVAALEELNEAVAERDWDAPVAEITGWHRHPLYNEIRADNVRRFCSAHNLDLADEGTEFVYSAHGTPRHYLDEGSRYDTYVEEFCEVVARKLGVESYSLGYQNHENRDIPWTEPDVEEVIEGLGDAEVDRVVVEPISFMHEQSETLSELDDELREEAEEVGLEFYRVPVPHDDERFSEVLADLAEPFVGDFDPGYYQFRQCQCSESPGAMCLNAPR